MALDSPSEEITDLASVKHASVGMQAKTDYSTTRIPGPRSSPAFSCGYFAATATVMLLTGKLNAPNMPWQRYAWEPLI
jgi:hypothetical protein